MSIQRQVNRYHARKVGTEKRKPAPGTFDRNIIYVTYASAVGVIQQRYHFTKGWRAEVRKVK